MKQEIQENLKRIIMQMKQLNPDEKPLFAKEASEASLQQAELLLQMSLPEEIKSLYYMHNGSLGKLVDVWHWLSLEEICQVWRENKEQWLTDEDIEADHYENPIFTIANQLRQPADILNFNSIAEQIQKIFTLRSIDMPLTFDERIRSCRWHIGWLPLVQGFNSDLYCIDLVPTAKGQAGQVIFFQNTSYDRTRVVASHLQAFLEAFANDLEMGVYAYDEETGGVWSESWYQKALFQRGFPHLGSDELLL